MLKRCWQARWYILLGLITFLVTLALTTPLHFIWRYLEPQIGGLPVEVSQIRGTIWQGRAQLKIQQLPVLGPIDSQWQLQFLPLLDRKSTRLNSSHVRISYAVFCLK